MKYSTRSIRRKCSHCEYNENGLHNSDVTWQPRRVDCNAHVWTMTTSLYWSVSECSVWLSHSKWLSRAMNLHQVLLILNIPLWKLFRWFEGCSCGRLVTGSFITTTCLLMHHVLFIIFWQNTKSPRWLNPPTAQIWCPATSVFSQN